MNNADRFSTMQDGPVEAALADYFDRLDRGESVELTEIIAAHPGCEVGLRRFLSQERNLHAAVAGEPLAAAAGQDLAGRMLGDFRLRRIIGRGGMGVVCEAEQVSLGRTVAVKLLPSALCGDPRHRTRFQNEARILAQLEHPNIVHVIAVGEDADAYYFAMQHVEGITADDLVRIWANERPPHDAETPIGRRSETDGDLPKGGQAHFAPTTPQNEPVPDAPWIAASATGRERYRASARIAADVADALAHAHECGVLHRDVKPSNILLDKSGVARLTDFGLARMYGDATLTATGAILGTLRYASPEQLRGTPTAIDERSDVYSLGVTLWEMVTGKRLFMAEDRNSVISQVLNVEAPRPSALDARVPRDLETVIGRAVAKEPADRYDSARAFADDLRRFLDGRPVQAKPISPAERAFRWANRNRVLATTAVGSLIVLATLALLANALILRANSRTTAALKTSQINEENSRQHAAAAEASAEKTRELLYAADMALAGAAWHKNEPAQARLILDRYATPTSRDDGSPADDPRGFEWYFLDHQIRHSSELLFKIEEDLYLIEFMPGGGEFFTAGKDAIVRWHNAKSGKVLRSLETKQREVNCVSYNPSRTMFATAGDDGSVKIWDATSLKLRQAISAYDNICYFARYLNDEMIISGGRSKVHRLHNAASGQLVREYMSPDATLAGNASAVSVDGHISLAGDRFWTTEGCDGRHYEGVYEWNVETGESRRISKDVQPCRVWVDSSERFLFVNTLGGQIRVLDAKSVDEIQSIGLDNSLEALVISPDERRLVAADRNGQIYVWRLDFSNPAEIVTPKTFEKFSIHDRDVYGNAFSPDGKSLVTAGRDGLVRRTRSETPIAVFRELAWLGGQFCFPISGSELVVTTEPLAVRERSTGILVKMLSTNHYTALATSSDGKLVAAGSPTHLVVWNLASGEAIFQMDQKRRLTRNLDLIADNSLLAVDSDDDVERRIDIVNISTGTMERYTDRGSGSRGAHFCIGNGLVAVNSTWRQVVCWNVHARTIRWQTSLERGGPSAISPDRRLLLKAQRRELTLYDCATGEVRYRALGDYPIKSVAFIGDGHSFVVGGERGQLSIWHTGTGQPLFEIANVGTTIESIQSLGDGFMVSTRQVKEGRSELVWLEF